MKPTLTLSAECDTFNGTMATPLGLRKTLWRFYRSAAFGVMT